MTNLTLKDIEKAAAVMDAIVALQNCPRKGIDFTLTVNDYELGIVITKYARTPPTGKCAQRCETPEEYYGEVELAYTVNYLHRGGFISRHTSTDTVLPEDLERSDVDTAVLAVLEGRG